MSTRPISIRLPLELLDHYQAVAERTGVPYQRLMKEALESGKPPLATRAAEPQATYSPTARQAVRPLRGRATAADLLLLEDEERFEIIDGELLERGAPRFEHCTAAFRLAKFLGDYDGPRRDDHRGGWWLGLEPHIEFEPHQVLVPDLAGWRRDIVGVPPRGMPVPVRPQWVCEIASPSTVRRDKVQKRSIYHRCGVEHYWILDPDERTLSVHRRQEEAYLIVLCAGPDETVRAEPFEGVELSLPALFGDDEA